jgi:rRNA maturation RNase YbeY
MRALNKRYRRKDRPTDVLSFPSPRDFRSRSGYLGDLAICVPVLRRQAREQGHAETRELRVLLVHGLLHLLGFDHEKGPRQAREMGRWEAVLLGRGATRGGLVARSGT